MFLKCIIYLYPYTGNLQDRQDTQGTQDTQDTQGTQDTQIYSFKQCKKHCLSLLQLKLHSEKHSYKFECDSCTKRVGISNFQQLNS